MGLGGSGPPSNHCASSAESYWYTSTMSYTNSSNESCCGHISLSVYCACVLVIVHSVLGFFVIAKWLERMPLVNVYMVCCQSCMSMHCSSITLLAPPPAVVLIWLFKNKENPLHNNLKRSEKSKSSIKAKCQIIFSFKSRDLLLFLFHIASNLTSSSFCVGSSPFTGI